jgi:hypothetical protein
MTETMVTTRSILYYSNNINLSIEINKTTSINDDTEFLLTHQYFVLGWISLVVILAGILGNLFTIVVLTKQNMRNSTNLFLTGLAISDLFALALILFLIPLRYILVSHHFIFYYELHAFLFPYLYPLATTFQFSSIFLTVCACTCRTIIVYYPINGNKICNTSRSFRILVFVFVFSLLVCIPFWFKYGYYQTFDQETNKTRIYISYTPISQTDWYKFFVHICLTTVFTYMLPLIFLCIMNTLLVKAMIDSRRRKSKLGLKLRERNEFYITIILIMIVIMFVICQMPNLILHIMHAINLKENESNFVYLFHQWANFLLILNSSLNFIIYCMFGKNFQNTVKKMLKLNDPNNAYNNHEVIRLNSLEEKRKESIKKRLSTTLQMIESMALVHVNPQRNSFHLLVNHRSYQTLD